MHVMFNSESFIGYVECSVVCVYVRQRVHLCVYDVGWDGWSVR